MKTTRKQEDVIEIEYLDWPGDEIKKGTISQWENGEGYDITLGDDKISLTHQELVAIQLLYCKAIIMK